MQTSVRSHREALRLFQAGLVRRGMDVKRVEKRVKPGNSRLFTQSHEVYHVKFTRKPFRPDAEKTGPARELHLKLHFAMRNFEYRSDALLQPSEKGTLVGIDEDLVLHLLELSEQGHSTYVVTVLGRGLTLWLDGLEFYEFVMRYDTFMKYPSSGVPVCYVPTGYFIPWAEPSEQPPAIVV